MRTAILVITLIPIFMVVILIFAISIFGAIMVTDQKEHVNLSDAGSAFIVLIGLTLISFFVWGVAIKIIPSFLELSNMIPQ